jgi:hypothetical protein
LLLQDIFSHPPDHFLYTAGSIEIQSATPSIFHDVSMAVHKSRNNNRVLGEKPGSNVRVDVFDRVYRHYSVSVKITRI